MTGWLVVNADDLGVSRGATLGVIRAHREGIVTSASLAATTPAYEHAITACVRTCPDLGIGLHFTLTSGKPVSDPSTVPLLVDERGFLRWRFTSLFAAIAIHGRRDLLDQVAHELEAQLDKLADDGIQPDHIDSERHVHLIPGIVELVVAAARRRGIPYVRAGTDAGSSCFPFARVPRMALGGGFAKSALLSSLARRAKRHIRDQPRSAAEVVSYFGSGQMHLVDRDAIARQQATGLVEVMVHPGQPGDSKGIELGNRELERYLLSDDRRKELDFCIEARGWLDQKHLTNFTRLAADTNAMVVPFREAHARPVAELHCATLTGLLSRLGPAAATAYYTGCARTDLAIGLVSLEGLTVRGFVLGAMHPDQLQGAAMRRNPDATIASLAGAVAVRPSTFVSLLKSFRGPDEGSFDATAPSLIYLAVDPHHQRGGVGKHLVDAFSERMRAAGAASYDLSVDEDNVAAIAFYERLGFRQIGQYREFDVQHRRYRLELR